MKNFAENGWKKNLKLCKGVETPTVFQDAEILLYENIALKLYPVMILSIKEVLEYCHVAMWFSATCATSGTM